MLQHGVEAGAIAVAVKRVEHVEPARRRPFQRAAPQSQTLLRLRTHIDAVGRHVPIEYDVARAHQRQGSAFRIRHRAVGKTTAGEGVLHHCEADKHHNQNKAADQGGRHEIPGQGARHCKARRRQPNQQQKPRRDQHHRALDAVQRQIKHQRKAGSSHRRQRNARHAGGNRGVEYGQSHQSHQEHQPDRGDMGGAHVPAIEVEIGEQEHQQRSRQNGFRARAPDAVGLALDAKQLVPEAEVDAHIGQHRPCKRGCGGKDHCALHHENNGEEESQQTGNADHNALVEG